MSPHRHQRPGAGGQRELQLALLVTVAMMVIECVAGWLSGSLALLADAAHMLTDASAIGLSVFASWFATRPATSEKTYGYHRTEILAALANGLALWVIVIWIDLGALRRLHHPLVIDTRMMLTVGVLGLAANLLSGWWLTRQRSQSLNVESAWRHVMSDAMGSVGVIVAAACVWWRGWTIADPLASVVISILVAFSSWTLVSQAVNILLEGTPSHLQIPDVIDAMRSITGVCAVHDVHLWTITTGMEAMSGHIVVEDVRNSAQILSALNTRLSSQFRISHTTLQLEPRQHVCQLSGASSS